LLYDLYHCLRSPTTCTKSYTCARCHVSFLWQDHYETHNSMPLREQICSYKQRFLSVHHIACFRYTSHSLCSLWFLCL